MGFTSLSPCLRSHLGVEEAIHWNSFFYCCPLKSQYVVRKPLPAHSCHALLLSLSSPLMPQTSQDILELDMYDVYLLINLCSKNGMRGNCLGSAGSEGVHDIRFSSDKRNATTMQQKGKGGHWMFLQVLLDNVLQATMGKYGFLIRLIWLCQIPPGSPMCEKNAAKLPSWMALR